MARRGRQEKKGKAKSSVLWQVMSLIIAVMCFEPEVWEFLGILLGIAIALSPALIPLVIYLRRRKHRKEHQGKLEDTSYTACTREKAFDERIQERLCFHKDKAVHHVARGKEVDPWDRPDIDISKYQRKE